MINKIKMQKNRKNSIKNVLFLPKNKIFLHFLNFIYIKNQFNNSHFQYSQLTQNNQKIKKRNKTILSFLIVFLLFLLFQIISPAFSMTSNSDLVQELTDAVNNQLGEIDLSGLEGILQNLTDTQSSIFNGSSVVDKLKALLTSEEELDFNTIFLSIGEILFHELVGIIPLLASIAGIAVISNLVGNLRAKTNAQSIGDIIHYVCFGLIIILTAGTMLSFLNLTKQTLLSLQSQMQIIFPILLTLMTAIGGTASVGIYQPAMSILSSAVVELFIYIVFPIFICSFVFNIVGNLSNTIKLDKFSNFFSSAFKWTVGTIFTLFATFMTIQGITAGSYDGLSIKSAKYAIKNYVPFVGGYLSDGFSIIMSSSILIKNALGVVGLFLLFATIILPVIKIVIFGLGLKLVSAIIEPVSDKRISNFVYGVSKSTNYLVAIILSVSFMYLITIALLMCTSNMII